MRVRPTARTKRERSDPAAIWSHYRDNLARHLIGIARDLESRVRHTLREEHGHAGLRPSFGPFLSLIWDEGRPLSAIASELAISNQAASQLANLVEEAGYLERTSNPADRRSKLVMLTERGRELVEQGVRIILETEDEYKALVGTRAYHDLIKALATLYRRLDLPTHGDPALTRRASRSVGVLPLIAVRIQRELMQATIARGHAGLKMSHGHVLPLIGPQGGRIHEIARIQRVSRQAISTTTRDLEAQGYVDREPDPLDRRGFVLVLTPRGVNLLEDAVAAVDVLELSFLDILGEDALERLKRTARALYRALHLETEIFGARLPLPRSVPDAFGSPEPKRKERDIEELAARLRQWLGSRDAARLAAELAPPTSRARRDAASPEARGLPRSRRLARELDEVED